MNIIIIIWTLIFSLAHGAGGIANSLESLNDFDSLDSVRFSRANDGLINVQIAWKIKENDHHVARCGLSIVQFESHGEYGK